MAVGLYGGSFDPPHAGHLALARAALIRLGLDRVVWLVSPGNPLKARGPAPLTRRMDAVRTLAVGPRMLVSDIEARLGSPYTIDTIRALKRRHPGVRFVWLMGADAMGGFHRWKGWRSILEEIPIAVFARPGHGPAAFASPAGKLLGAPRRAVRRAVGPRPAWSFTPMPLRFEASTQLRSSEPPKNVI